MSEAKHTEMYEHMVEDVIDLPEPRNPVAKKDCLIGLCMAVEMMLDNEHEKVVADRDALLAALKELGIESRTRNPTAFVDAIQTRIIRMLVSQRVQLSSRPISTRKVEVMIKVHNQQELDAVVNGRKKSKSLEMECLTSVAPANRYLHVRHQQAEHLTRDNSEPSINTYDNSKPYIST